MKKHCLQYTAIIFAVFLGLSIIQTAMKIDFGYIVFNMGIPGDILKLILLIPILLLISFGIVSIILYVNTNVLDGFFDIKLPYFNGFKEPKSSKYNLIGVGFMTAFFVALIYMHRSYGSIFYLLNRISDNWGYVSLEQQNQLSTFILILLSIDILTLYVNAFYNSNILVVMVSIAKLTIIGEIFKEVLMIDNILEILKNRAIGIESIFTAVFTFAFFVPP